MRHTTHILLTLLLALVGSATISAHDFEVANADGVTIYYVKLTDSTCAVSYRGSNPGSDSDEYTGHVAIPSSVEHYGITYSVTSIGNEAFYGCSSLISVEIPNSVTAIGEGAFWGCSSLLSVEIPNSVTAIGNYAFSGCKSLQSVEFPANVEEMGHNPFARCENLTDLRVADGNNNFKMYDGCLISTDGVLITGLMYSSSVSIPNSVTAIGEDAFSGCSSLQSVEIPNSVTSIGNFAFSSCSSLQSVEIPNSVTSIGFGAFEGCSSLQSVEIPNSVIEIGQEAFRGCSSLQSVEIPNFVTTIGSSAFAYCNNIQFATFGCLPYVAKEIPRNKLKEITLLGNITNFLSYPFKECGQLQTLTSLALEPPTLTSNQFSASQYQNLEVLVPDEALEKYMTANVWKDFVNLKGINGGTAEVKKCEKPTIAYSDGELSFSCATEGATFVYNVRENCTVSNAKSAGNSIMKPVYTVTAYATADGYQNSDIATATFDLSDGYKEVEKEVIVYVYDSSEAVDIALETGETIKLYLATGKVTIVDAPLGAVVSVYSDSGAMVKALTVNDVATTFDLPSDRIYIVKVGEKVFKVKV